MAVYRYAVNGPGDIEIVEPKLLVSLSATIVIAHIKSCHSKYKVRTAKVGHLVLRAGERIQTTLNFAAENIEVGVIVECFP
jgi:hypothetical protein